MFIEGLACKVVEVAACAGALGEKHETNLFVDGGKGVNLKVILNIKLW